MILRALARRLAFALVVLLLLFVAFVVFLLPKLPRAQARAGHLTHGLAAGAEHAGAFVLHLVLVVLLAGGAIAALVSVGHLVGRFLRRPGPTWLPGRLGGWVEAQRHHRAPVWRRVALGRDDRAAPYEVAKLLDGLHGQLRPRWYERLSLGADTLTLQIANDPAARLVRFAVAARADTITALEHRLRTTYPDVRLTALPPPPAVAAVDVVRVRKTRRSLWSLQTTRDYEHSVIEALVNALAGGGLPAQVQLALTPAPRLVERLATRAIRRAEQKLKTDVAISPTAPGNESVVASKHLQGAVEGVGRSLYFTDIRIVVPRARQDLARALAGALHEGRGENDLAWRAMRARRNLYAKRVTGGIPPLLPDLLRGVCNTAELATLWHLPTLRVKGVGLERSGSRQTTASAAISRDRRHTLLVDEHGPLGLRPDDLRYGIAVMGAAGGGKSALTARHVGNIARDPERALIVIDPKEDLARAVLAAIPASRTVHYIDLGHPHVGINPLTALRARGVAPEVIADVMVAAIREAGAEGGVGARSDQFLRAGFHAVCVAEEIPTLLHVYRMLDPDDSGYRQWVVRELARHPETEHIRDFWGRRFNARAAANPKFLAEIMEAPLNKLSRFLAVPSLAYLTSHPVQLDLAQLVDDREILVVNGAKGAVGEDNAVLFAQVLVLLVQKLLHQQQRLDAGARARVALVIDEAHNLFTPSFATMLSEGRSGGLEVLAAFQYTQQIVDERVRSGIKSLLQNISIFRLREFEDARAAAALAMEVFADNIRGDVEDAKRLRVDPIDIVNLPNYRSINLWLADGVPQHAFTGQTIPTEQIEQLPNAAKIRAHHLAEQARRGYHPHDHGERIVPPLVWSIDVAAQVHDGDLHVDLAGWDGRPEDVAELTISLRLGRRRWTLAATPVDLACLRWSAELPTDLPGGRYKLEVICGERRWHPTSPLIEGDAVGAPVQLATVAAKEEAPA